MVRSVTYTSYTPALSHNPHPGQSSGRGLVSRSYAHRPHPARTSEAVQSRQFPTQGRLPVKGDGLSDHHAEIIPAFSVAYRPRCTAVARSRLPENSATTLPDRLKPVSEPCSRTAFLRSRAAEKVAFGIRGMQELMERGRGFTGPIFWTRPTRRRGLGVLLVGAMLGHAEATGPLSRVPLTGPPSRVLFTGPLFPASGVCTFDLGPIRGVHPSVSPRWI
jgi:hypothetical protein